MINARVKFLRAYANIPENLRKDIIVVIDKQPYTWSTAYIEIKNDTRLAKKILKELEEMKIL